MWVEWLETGGVRADKKVSCLTSALITVLLQRVANSAKTYISGDGEGGGLFRPQDTLLVICHSNAHCTDVNAVLRLANTCWE